MKRFNFLPALLLAAAMLSGFRTAGADDLENLLNNRQNRQQILNQFNQAAAPAADNHARTAANASANANARGGADQLIGSAMGLLGVAYRYGGTSVRTGFDCSGFMQYIFRNAAGLNLPRTAAEQATMGTHVDRSELQPGDMVFFRTMGRGRISHVGLYIGNDRFIHAPRTGKNIEITSLSHKYWGAKYAFGRRVKKHDAARFVN
ncbi:C40 family peptidase [Neisseria sp. ZJ106]|uniref:C40 family peptidase n=1 Tax=Neisseria lisongii TaxID=2912188 RepID=A0AAW5AM52_9NEIS|nr:C40 family peptidase [Neisseria lisongii]MCF7520590.1 C40 family peptidase [Neisseria lisongii]MCF7529008.1 C40 family peptidase [Neisseria lisongii]WCL71474.1 C40 family peptidase [Neisseria lisongii]